MRSRPSDSTDPLDRWEQRQQASRSSSSRMSPRARQLAAKNASLTAGCESSRSGLGAAGTFRMIGASLLILPFSASCGALLGALFTSGSTTGIVVGAIAMILVPIPFAAQRYLRKQDEKVAKQRLASDQYEIHQHNLRRARGEE